MLCLCYGMLFKCNIFVTRPFFLTDKLSPSANPSGPLTFLKSIRSAWTNLSPNIRGAGFVALGAFFLIIMASLVKDLGKTLPIFEILFVRFLAGLLVLLPVIWRMGFDRLRTKKLHYHVARGLVGFMGNMCFFFALTYMAISDTVTIQFSRPLIMTLIATFFLKEVIGWRRSIIAIIGFTGIVMITRPFGDGFEPWALVALSGTFFATLVVLMIKLLSRTEQTVVIMFYFALFTTLIALIPALLV